VLFKVIKEGLWILAASVVAIEHVRISHVVRIVTEKKEFLKIKC
jgi:hypothetical protein